MSQEAPAERGPVHLPVHVPGEVLAVKNAGIHRQLTLIAPGVGERSRPGSFVALSAGEDRIGRRSFWIQRVHPQGGHGTTLDIVVEPTGAGSRWLAALVPGARIEVTGPLGRPFALPREKARCLLMGEGHSAAALTMLAERLRDRGCSVELVLAAVDESQLFGVLEARRSVARVEVVTDAAALAATITKAAAGADVVYAAGSLSAARLCAEAAASAGAQCQVALERPLLCATGLCQGCPVVVRDASGDRRTVRACTEGPVFRADRLDWESLA
jgi:dihydroorotate dehydrogenase electron transfer subunit